MKVPVDRTGLDGSEMGLLELMPSPVVAAVVSINCVAGTWVDCTAFSFGGGKY